MVTLPLLKDQTDCRDADDRAKKKKKTLFDVTVSRGRDTNSIKDFPLEK